MFPASTTGNRVSARLLEHELIEGEFNVFTTWSDHVSPHPNVCASYLGKMWILPRGMERKRSTWVESTNNRGSCYHTAQSIIANHSQSSNSIGTKILRLNLVAFLQDFAPFPRTHVQESFREVRQTPRKTTICALSQNLITSIVHDVVNRHSLVSVPRTCLPSMSKFLSRFGLFWSRIPSRNVW